MICWFRPLRRQRRRRSNPLGNTGFAPKLIGGAKSPRDGIGVTVFVTAGEIRQRGDVFSDSSYESSSDSASTLAGSISRVISTSNVRSN